LETLAVNAGVDTLEFTAGDLSALAEAFAGSVGFSDSALGITVTGTGFIGGPSADDGVDILFGLSQGMDIVPLPNVDTRIGALVTSGFDLGDSSFEMFSAMPGLAASLGLSIGFDTFASFEFESAQDINQILASLQSDASSQHLPFVQLDDALARALAMANASFVSPDAGGDYAAAMLWANANHDNGGAYLQSSLSQLSALNVDEVHVAQDTQAIEIVLGDEGTAIDLDFIGGMPRFVHEAWQKVSLVVDPQSLQSLIETEGALTALFENGISQLRLNGSFNANQLDELDRALLESGVAGESGSDPLALLYELHPLTSTEIELLGVGNTEDDPFGLNRP
jgi:hypothetical protein